VKSSILKTSLIVLAEPLLLLGLFYLVIYFSVFLSATVIEQGFSELLIGDPVVLVPRIWSKVCLILMVCAGSYGVGLLVSRLVRGDRQRQGGLLLQLFRGERRSKESQIGKGLGVSLFLILAVFWIKIMGRHSFSILRLALIESEQAVFTDQMSLHIANLQTLNQAGLFLSCGSLLTGLLLLVLARFL
jgi:hypothetical protein